MKRDQLIILGAVAFAGVLVANKMGMFKAKPAAAWRPGKFQSDTAFDEAPGEEGYDPANPGKFVFVDDLLQGVTDRDWSYTPSVFEQTADDVFYRPTYRPGT